MQVLVVEPCRLSRIVRDVAGAVVDLEIRHSETTLTCAGAPWFAPLLPILSFCMPAHVAKMQAITQSANPAWANITIVWSSSICWPDGASCVARKNVCTADKWMSAAACMSCGDPAIVRAWSSLFLSLFQRPKSSTGFYGPRHRNQIKKNQRLI